MSIQLIQKYHADIDRIIRYGGSRNESSLRKPFQVLLEGYARRPCRGVGISAGIYSALEWILGRTKEKKPKDPTIAEKFNTYEFADYKEQVIELLQRVCTVSVETMKIVKEMPA